MYKHVLFLIGSRTSTQYAVPLYASYMVQGTYRTFPVARPSLDGSKVKGLQAFILLTGPGPLTCVMHMTGFPRALLTPQKYRSMVTPE